MWKKIKNPGNPVGSRDTYPRYMKNSGYSLLSQVIPVNGFLNSCTT